MRNCILKVLSVALCLTMVLSFAACSSDENNAKPDPNSNNVNFGDLDAEFKYSKDCSNWTEVKADSELFRADGVYQANDAEVVYLHFKNHNDHAIVYKVKFRVTEGDSGEATVGIVNDVRTAFAASSEAVTAMKDSAHKLGDSYVYAAYMGADTTKTVAVVLHNPSDAAEMKLRVDYSAVAIDIGTQNSSVIQGGIITVNANAYAIVDDSTGETVVANSDRSFKAVFSADSNAQGTVLTAVVKPDQLKTGELNYNISLGCDGKEYTGTSAIGVSLLAGYGLEGVEVFADGTKIESKYDMYSGMVEFTAQKSCSITVKYSGSVNIEGILVQGSDKPFGNFNEAISYVTGEGAESIGDTVSFIIFGRAEYTVATGEKISFTGDNESIKTVNVLGGNDTAEIFITQSSGLVPSLPYAGQGVQINYSNLSFQSENELLDGGDYSRHFDYRGEADIAFRGCTFKKALATRGPNSSVVVDNCAFKCTEYEDTFKGYCYYSVQKIGGGEITVEFTNNDCTGSWGGINLDWSEGDFIVKYNKFGGYNCSKPAIQLSHANTMLIEENEFSNIKDENAFRFYQSYNCTQTTIINNTIDADYLFHSDKEYAIDDYNIVFEGNIISNTTDLTLGHMANAPADSVREHGYCVDTQKNTIK